MRRDVCEARGCSRTPSFGKSACEEHITRLPYASQLEAEVKARKDEDTIALTAWESLDVNSSRCQEALRMIREEGALSVAGLGLRLELDRSTKDEPRAIAMGYVRALERAGLVRSFEKLGRHGRKPYVEVLEK